MLRNFFNFRGRASRSEFWWFLLIVLVVGLFLVDRFNMFWSWSFFFILDLLYFLLSLVVILPAIYLVVMPAATVRRLHDTGRSARWLLLCVALLLGWGIIAGVTSLVASTGEGWEALGVGLVMGFIWFLTSLVGIVAMTIVLALPGNVGPNSYGPDRQWPEQGDEFAPQPVHAHATPQEAEAADDEPSVPVSRQFCTQCGAQLQAEARFCTQCGAAV